MKREEKLIKNTAILSLGILLPKLAVFVTLPIYTKYLTQSEYGMYDLIINMVSLAIPLITLQIQEGAFRYLIDEKNETKISQIVSTSIFFNLVTIVLISIIVWGVYGAIDVTLKTMILIYFILDAILQVMLQIIRGLGNTKQYSIGSIINASMGVIFVVPILVNLKMGLNGLILALSIAMLISIIYFVKTTDISKYLKIKRFNKKYLKILLKYSVPIIPNSIAWWFLNVSDRMIITGILGLEANAIYAAANKIPTIYNLAYTTFNMAWQESATIEKKSEDVEIYYSKMFNYLFKFLLGMMLLLVAVSPFLFKILLDTSYNDAFYQMPILFLGLFFYSFSNFYGGIFVALKETKKIASSSVIAAVVNIIINLMLIQNIGIYAGSISTLVAYIVVAILRARGVQKHYKIDYKYLSIILGIVLLSIECFLIYIQNWVWYCINFIIVLIIAIILNKQFIKQGLNLLRKTVKLRNSNS